MIIEDLGGGGKSKIGHLKVIFSSFNISYTKFI